MTGRRNVAERATKGRWRLVALTFVAGLSLAPVLHAQEARPQTRPNVIVVLMDDVGFASDSTFGGPVPTPVLDRLAAQGLTYNRFHVTAMCSPTRAALLTGRNHHRVEMGVIVNLARDEPGYRTAIPDSAATIADVLGEHGYASAWLGKNHVTPMAEQTSAGPYDRWPTGLGFDYFYGFMDGASSQFAPILVNGRTPIDPVPDPAADPDYIFDQDMADQAIDWITRLRNDSPDRPFLLYLAPGTGHEPHQAPEEWRGRFRGQFDMGWDVLRQQIFERQKAAGLIPADTIMSPRPDPLPAWDSLSPEEQRFASRLMETYAAMRAHFDYQFGRIMAELEASGQWENTLVIFMDGDNGSSGEGGLYGTSLGLINRSPEPLDYRLSVMERIGTPDHGSNYNAGWGWALNAPFPWFKQHAGHLGATRAGMVISWPAQLGSQAGTIRDQYAHVVDIAPTIYEAAGITPPAVFEGVEQLPLDGTSLVYSFADPEAPSRRTTQYYEMLGNVGMYQDGWLATLAPPNVMFAPQFGQEKHWELYNLETDFAQARNVADQHPDRLATLLSEWEEQQAANGFSVASTFHISEARLVSPGGRPQPGQTLTYRRSDNPILDNGFPAVSDRNWSLDVTVTVAEGAQGTLISQGGYPFGWGLYVIDGRPTFLYSNSPWPLARLEGPALAAGEHRLTLRVRTDPGPGSGRPANVSLDVNGEDVVHSRIERTVPSYWGANGVGIGREVGTVMTPETGKPFVFTGTMGPVSLMLDPPMD